MNCSKCQKFCYSASTTNLCCACGDTRTEAEKKAGTFEKTIEHVYRDNVEWAYCSLCDTVEQARIKQMKEHPYTIASDKLTELKETLKTFVDQKLLKETLKTFVDQKLLKEFKKGRHYKCVKCDDSFTYHALEKIVEHVPLCQENKIKNPHKKNSLLYFAFEAKRQGIPLRERSYYAVNMLMAFEDKSQTKETKKETRPISTHTYNLRSK